MALIWLGRVIRFHPIDHRRIFTEEEPKSPARRGFTYQMRSAELRMWEIGNVVQN